jgi:hypothetical protein
LKFDPPVPELTEDADVETVEAIEKGIAQLDAGQGIAIAVGRGELARRCSK